MNSTTMAAGKSSAHLSSYDITQVFNEVFGFVEGQLRHVLLHVVESGALEQILFDEQIQLDDPVRWLARVDAWGQEAGG